jgi:hypothetical protein
MFAMQNRVLQLKSLLHHQRLVWRRGIFYFIFLLFIMTSLKEAGFKLSVFLVLINVFEIIRARTKPMKHSTTATKISLIRSVLIRLVWRRGIFYFIFLLFIMTSLKEAGFKLSVFLGANQVTGRCLRCKTECYS